MKPASGALKRDVELGVSFIMGSTRDVQCRSSSAGGGKAGTYGRLCMAIALALCILLPGCGNNVMSLLQEEIQIAWDAHQVAMDAGDLEPGIEDAFFDAELAKLEACRPIDEAVAETVEAGGALSFAKQFVGDASRLVAFVIPLPSVEKCAKAHDVFQLEYSALRTRLEEYASADFGKP